MYRLKLHIGLNKRPKSRNITRLTILHRRIHRIDYISLVSIIAHGSLLSVAFFASRCVQLTDHRVQTTELKSASQDGEQGASWRWELYDNDTESLTVNQSVQRVQRIPGSCSLKTFSRFRKSLHCSDYKISLPTQFCYFAVTVKLRCPNRPIPPDL